MHKKYIITITDQPNSNVISHSHTKMGQYNFIASLYIQSRDLHGKFSAGIPREIPRVWE